MAFILFKSIKNYYYSTSLYLVFKLISIFSFVVQSPQVEALAKSNKIFFIINLMIQSTRMSYIRQREHQSILWIRITLS